MSLHVKLYLDKEKYTLLNDCTLPDEENLTTQIDHILLSPYGIFVIETKNYKGWIITAFKDGKIDMDFFKGWIKINNLIFEFLDKDPTHSMNSLNKVLQELE